MTISEIIVEADKLRPNAVDAETKTRWIFMAESDIADALEEDEPENPFPDIDSELLITGNDSYLYVFFLCAMIDYFSGEIDLYTNDMSVYDSRLSEVIAKKMRKTKKASGGNWRTM